jgi:hypothetical protein
MAPGTLAVLIAQLEEQHFQPVRMAVNISDDVYAAVHNASKSTPGGLSQFMNQIYATESRRQSPIDHVA